MNRAKGILIASFSLVVVLLLAAAINYWYRPAEIKPQSYRYVNNLTSLDITTNQIKYIESVWHVAVNFTTHDVFAAGSKIDVAIIARPQDDYNHQNASISFAHAVDWKTDYSEGHAVAADIPITQDPFDPHKFTGTGIVRFIQAGPDCLIIKEKTLFHKEELFCPKGFDPIIDVESADSRLQFENNKINISLILFIGAISSAASGVIVNYLLPKPKDDSSSSESTGKSKKGKSRRR